MKMTLSNKSILLGSIMLLSACATTGDYQAYINAQATAIAQHQPKPLLVLEAHDGQAITGLKRVEVNMPGSAPVIQQARENEWARVLDRALGVVGTIGGVYVGGKAAVGLAKAVGEAAKVPAAPQPNISYSYTDSYNETGDYSGAGSGVTNTTTNNSYNPISNAYNPVDNSNDGSCTTGNC